MNDTNALDSQDSVMQAHETLLREPGVVIVRRSTFNRVGIFLICGFLLLLGTAAFLLDRGSPNHTSFALVYYIGCAVLLVVTLTAGYFFSIPASASFDPQSKHYSITAFLGLGACELRGPFSDIEDIEIRSTRSTKNSSFSLYVRWKDPALGQRFVVELTEIEANRLLPQLESLDIPVRTVERRV